MILLRHGLYSSTRLHVQLGAVKKHLLAGINPNHEASGHDLVLMGFVLVFDLVLLAFNDSHVYSQAQI